jgi:hypothetical protein
MHNLTAVAADSGSDWIAPTVVLALLALAVSLATFFLGARRDRLDRQRQLFADAFEVVMEYREYPFIVRRRSADEPAKERQRISGDLSKVQAKLNAYRARLLIEDRYVGERYVALVKKTREVAGGEIRSGWDQEPVGEDGAMHSPGFDFSVLDAYDTAYLVAVGDHLGWVNATLRRTIRWPVGRKKPPSA